MGAHAVTRRAPAVTGQAGFTIVELLVALTVLLIGITGLLSLQVTAMQSTSFSRHATEAAVLAEDRMEELRTAPAEMILAGAAFCPDGDPSGVPGPCAERLDTSGRPDDDGLFFRRWTAVQGGSMIRIQVRVSWEARGGGLPHEVLLQTERAF
jgi:prepilin-type N-terminal cleavage/methylation domain-containing protein